ncbi:MAG: hypothetical protein V3R64_03400 [Sphingomonadales bacterium]
MTFIGVLKADYLQRFRGQKFGLVLLATAFFAFLLFPGANAGYSVIDLYGYRGLYNSAWMGDTLAIVNSMFMPLIGFYLFKNAIALDRKTKVDMLLKSSPLKNHNYIFGKWLSNVFLILTLVLVMNIVAILKQVYLGESYQIDLIALLSHQAVLSFPILLITASFALLFESLPVLRGGIGNMIYVFLWTPMLVVQMEGGFGAAVIVDNLEASIEEGARLKDEFVIGDEIIDVPLVTFEWSGFPLDAGIWLNSLYATAFALTLLIISLLVFRHRFEGLNLGNLIKKKSKKPIANGVNPSATLTPLGTFKSHFGALQLLRGEMRLMFRSHHLAWYGGVILLIVLSQTLNMQQVTTIILPLTALWGTLIFSQMGCRDFKNHTEVLVGCTIYGESLRLAAGWLAGVFLQLTLFSGLFARFYLEGQLNSIPILLVAALFIPALAISLGRITSSSRTFEFLFMLLLYIGPIDHVPGFDFLGTSVATTPPPVMSFLSATFILVMTTLLIGQKERLKRVFA